MVYKELSESIPNLILWASIAISGLKILTAASLSFLLLCVNLSSSYYCNLIFSLSPKDLNPESNSLTFELGRTNYS